MQIALILALLATAADAPGSSAGAPLRVLLDCRGSCGDDYEDYYERYFRREIAFVSFVRNPEDASVQALLRRRRAGGGGRQWGIQFIGRGPFDGEVTELAYTSENGESQDDVRKGILRKLKVGLLPFVMRAGGGDDLDVVQVATTDLHKAPADMPDPWDYWVFGLELEGELDGEKRRRELDTEAELFADRVTEDWKVQLEAKGALSREDFDLSDGPLVNQQYGYRVRSLVVGALTDHWSIGGDVRTDSSTFANRKVRARLAPTIEYNVFPYSEALTHRLSFRYQIRGNYIRYNEITIFDKIDEYRIDQELLITLVIIRPWGNMAVGIEFDNFLPEVEQHSAELEGALQVRLARGISIKLSAAFERVKNQINLPRGDIMDEDVLIETRQLGTDYEYSAAAALVLSSGSIYNNVVNPRFSD